MHCISPLLQAHLQPPRKAWRPIGRATGRSTSNIALDRLRPIADGTGIATRDASGN